MVARQARNSYCLKNNVKSVLRDKEKERKEEAVEVEEETALRGDTSGHDVSLDSAGRENIRARP